MKALRIGLLLLLGAGLGQLFLPSAKASESSPLDRIAATLDKLLDAVRDGARRETKVERVCRCER